VDFQVTALDAEQFRELHGLDDAALARRGVERQVVDEKPGFPCRVSLVDAEIGETVLLFNFKHQPADTPYRSSHAIFVREGAETAKPAKNEVPELLKIRTLSVRAFDEEGMMLDADVVDGENLADLIHRLFHNRSVEYLHVHNAGRGCYAAAINRA
jgi:hypothetical protein